MNNHAADSSRRARRLPSRKLVDSNDQADLARTVSSLRNLLPYIKDWEAWQREVRRLERNVVKLRRHKELRLARTLEDSLPALKSVLSEEKVHHQFSVNRSIAELDDDEIGYDGNAHDGIAGADRH